MLGRVEALMSFRERSWAGLAPALDRRAINVTKEMTDPMQRAKAIQRMAVQGIVEVERLLKDGPPPMPRPDGFTPRRHNLTVQFTE
jgi:hypothetical protein